MPQHMRRHPLVDIRAPRRPPNRLLKRRVAQMMSPPQPRRRIHARLPRRKHPLPTELLARFLILSRQPLRQPPPPATLPPDPSLNNPRNRSTCFFNGSINTTGSTVTRPLSPLPPCTSNCPPLRIHMMHPQPQQFHQPQPSAIRQLRHQPLLPKLSPPITRRQRRLHTPPEARLRPLHLRESAFISGSPLRLVRFQIRNPKSLARRIPTPALHFLHLRESAFISGSPLRLVRFQIRNLKSSPALTNQRKATCNPRHASWLAPRASQYTTSVT